MMHGMLKEVLFLVLVAAHIPFSNRRILLMCLAKKKALQKIQQPHVFLISDIRNVLGGAVFRNCRWPKCCRRKPFYGHADPAF